MNVIYDPKTDVLTVEFRPGPIAESDENKPGVILDYDSEGRLVSVEILDASKHIPDVAHIDIRVAV